MVKHGIDIHCLLILLNILSGNKKFVMFANKLNCMCEAFTTVFTFEGCCDLKPNSFLFNSLGAIPGIGLAVGIVRLMNIPQCNDHASIKEDEFHNKCLKAFCITRAVLEIVGLGIICLLINIIISIACCLINCVSVRTQTIKPQKT